MPINKIFEERQHQSSGFPPFLMELEGDRSFIILGGDDNIIDVRDYKIVDHRRGKKSVELFPLLRDETKEFLTRTRERA